MQVSQKATQQKACSPCYNKSVANRLSSLNTILLCGGALLLIFIVFYYHKLDSAALLRRRLAEPELLSRASTIYSSGSYWREGEIQGLVIGKLKSKGQLQSLLRSKPFKDCTQPGGCTDWVSGHSFQTYLIGNNSYDLFKQLQDNKVNVDASQFLDSTSRCITRYSSYTHGESPQTSSNRDELCVTEDGTFAYAFRDF